MFPNLSKLNVEFLDGLEVIWQLDDNIEENGESVPYKLSVLMLDLLPNLTGFLSASSTTPFEHLTTLVVFRCDFMVSLLAPLTAKSMPQLKTLSLIDCKSMGELISGASGEGEIVFAKLEAVILGCLPKLVFFHSGSYTFIFPNLKRLAVLQCPEMQSFSSVAMAPKLEGIVTRTNSKFFLAAVTLHDIVVRRGFERNGVEICRVQWDGDINSTLQKLHRSSDKILLTDVDASEDGRDEEDATSYGSENSVEDAEVSDEEVVGCEA